MKRKTCYSSYLHTYIPSPHPLFRFACRTIHLPKPQTPSHTLTTNQRCCTTLCSVFVPVYAPAPAPPPPAPQLDPHAHDGYARRPDLAPVLPSRGDRAAHHRLGGVRYPEVDFGLRPAKVRIYEYSTEKTERMSEHSHENKY